MPIGPGKYDDEANDLLQKLGEVEGLVIIVIGGPKGHGISGKISAEHIPIVSGMITEIARQLKVDAAALKALVRKEKM